MRGTVASEGDLTPGGTYGGGLNPPTFKWPPWCRGNRAGPCSSTRAGRQLFLRHGADIPLPLRRASRDTRPSPTTCVHRPADIKRRCALFMQFSPYLAIECLAGGVGGSGNLQHEGQ